MAKTIQTPAKKDTPVEDKVSWIDDVLMWIDKLPWPAWVFYIVYFLSISVLMNGAFWIDGSVAPGKFITLPTTSLPLVTAVLALYHHLTDAGRKALQNFRPLLDADEEEIHKIDIELNHLTPRLGWIVLFFSIFGSSTYLFTSTDPFGGIVAKTILPWTVVFLVSIVAVLPVYAQIFRMARQLQVIPKLHQRATGINLLQLAPTHAFARLTAGSGGGLIVVWVLGVMHNPELITNTNNNWGIIVGGLLVILVFFVPLAGLRRRLIDEKIKRLDEVNTLLDGVIKTLHQKAEKENYKGGPELNSVMSGLMQERALIEKVSTWPWDTSTIRGFISAIFLPILIWFITRLLDQYL